MSGYRRTSRSSPDAMLVNGILSVSPNTSSTDAAGITRQTTWPDGYYDPFDSMTIQDQPPTPFETRFSLGLQRSDRQVHDAYVESNSQTATTARHLLQQSQHDYPSMNATQLGPSEMALVTGAEGRTTHARRQSTDSFGSHSMGLSDFPNEVVLGQTQDRFRGESRLNPRRKPYNQDEFDGPSQFLPHPSAQQEHDRSQPLPQQPVNLSIKEQDEVIKQTNDVLATCAFHFIAKYQFPVPLENKMQIRSPSDREWAEWAYLLKRLATKRRIPARVLYENQIKQLVTTLENSIMARQPEAKTRGAQLGSIRLPKDDRYILQLISAGIQVSKILKDSIAMKQLDILYTRTESEISERKSRARLEDFNFGAR